MPDHLHDVFLKHTHILSTHTHINFRSSTKQVGEKNVNQGCKIWGSYIQYLEYENLKKKIYLEPLKAVNFTQYAEFHLSYSNFT